MCHKSGAKGEGMEEQKTNILRCYSIEQARKLANFSQYKMAQALNLSINGYIKKEKGFSRFYIDEAIKFSAACGIPIEKINFF